MDVLEAVRVDEGEPLARRLTEIAIRFRVEGHLFHSFGDPSPESPFAEANAHYPWEKTSDWCREYLSAALESALLWADFHAPLSFAPDAAVNIRPRPVQGLGRSALESASQSVWVMTADRTTNLARRHLRLMHSDFIEQRKAYRLQGLRIDKAERQLETFTKRLHGRFELGEIAQRITYLDMIRASAESMDRDPDEFEFTWRLASGSTHGKRWAVFENNDIEVLEEYEPGQIRTLRTPRLDVLLRVLAIAYETIQHGVVVFAARSGIALSDYKVLLGDAVAATARELPVKPGLEDQRNQIVRSLEA